MTNKKTRAITIIIIVGLIVFSIIAWVMIISIDYASPVAYIYKNGELIETIDLKNAETSYEMDVFGHNTIEVRNGEIGVIKADCPDKLCVKTGFIKGALPIICLPNRLEIRVKNGANIPEIDALTY